MIALATVTLIPLVAISQDSVKVPVRVFDYMATEGVKSNMYYQDNINLSAINLGLKSQLDIQKNVVKEYRSQIIEMNNKEDIYLSQIQAVTDLNQKQQKKLIQSKRLLWAISAVSAGLISYVAVR